MIYALQLGGLGRVNGVSPFVPSDLYLAGEQGAWYDKSDLSTLQQNADGTTPLTGVEQPVGRMQDKSGRTNHATQATTAAKATLSARFNLIAASEDFTAAAWSKRGGSVTANSVLAPDGNLTADKFVEDTTTGRHDVSQSASRDHMLARPRIRAKAAGRTIVYINIRRGGAANFAVCVNLTTGAVGTFYDEFGSFSGLAANVTALADGWYDIQLSYTSGPDTGSIFVGPAVSMDASTPSYAGDGTSGIHLWGGSFVTSSDVSKPYQYVNTATDYNATDFPRYLRYDRVDDFMSAAGGGGGTTGILICAGIRTSGAGTARTIWSDRGTNAGYRLSVNASNALVLSAGNGTAHTEVVGPTITDDVDYVVMGWHDGTNLRVRAGLAAATAAAFGTATAGTAGFTMGRDNEGATGFFGDRINGLVYRRNDASTATERDDLTRWMAGKVGATV